jgi:DNA-binding CsgD family transcriptional regulator
VNEPDRPEDEIRKFGVMEVDPRDTITPRQLELLALYASGYSLSEIATMKFLAIATVNRTMGRARERVGAKNMAHLCVLCLDAGIIRKNGTGYKPVQEEGVVGE